MACKNEEPRADSPGHCMVAKGSGEWWLRQLAHLAQLLPRAHRPSAPDSAAPSSPLTTGQTDVMRAMMREPPRLLAEAQPFEQLVGPSSLPLHVSGKTKSTSEFSPQGSISRLMLQPSIKKKATRVSCCHLSILFLIFPVSPFFELLSTIRSVVHVTPCPLPKRVTHPSYLAHPPCCLFASRLLSTPKPHLALTPACQPYLSISISIPPSLSHICLHSSTCVEATPTYPHTSVTHHHHASDV